jgi:hypothetical protein
MTTKADVKLNGEYEWVATTDPPSGLNPIYSAGDRWLNSVSGDSFILTDADAGTWTAFESALDAKIEAVLADTYARIFGECFQSFVVQRSVELGKSPDTITRTALCYLNTYVSIYADWTITDASIAADSADDVVGSLEDFEYEDEAFVYGSKRNDGRHVIESIDAAGLTFAADLVGTGERFLVLLLKVPAQFDQIVGRMVYYDVTLRAKRLGLETERIGTYSYTVGETVGGVDYPRDVVAGLRSYLNAGPIVDVEYTP